MIYLPYFGLQNYRLMLKCIHVIYYKFNGMRKAMLKLKKALCSILAFSFALSVTGTQVFAKDEMMESEFTFQDNSLESVQRIADKYGLEISELPKNAYSRNTRNINQIHEIQTAEQLEAFLSAAASYAGDVNFQNCVVDSSSFQNRIQSSSTSRSLANWERYDYFRDTVYLEEWSPFQYSYGGVPLSLFVWKCVDIDFPLRGDKLTGEVIFEGNDANISSWIAGIATASWEQQNTIYNARFKNASGHVTGHAYIGFNYKGNVIGVNFRGERWYFNLSIS